MYILNFQGFYFLLKRTYKRIRFCIWVNLLSRTVVILFLNIENAFFFDFLTKVIDLKIKRNRTKKVFYQTYLFSEAMLSSIVIWYSIVIQYGMAFLPLPFHSMGSRIVIPSRKMVVNPLSTNPQKWLNTLIQFVGFCKSVSRNNNQQNSCNAWQKQTVYLDKKYKIHFFRNLKQKKNTGNPANGRPDSCLLI